MNKIQKLPGFRDFFAQDVQIRQYVINTFKAVFEKYGYEPLETPALEYTEIFSGESGTEAEKLFFKFTDSGNRSVMLKYEVMISMCRAVAENINTMVFPYKRYQIQNVWRAEKPQKGRYREFTQCDADTVGSRSVIWDAEFIQMGIEAMRNLGFESFRANVSNRKFLSGLVTYAGGAADDFIPICLCIDKLPKIGRDAVLKEMTDTKSIPGKIAEKILSVVTSQGSSNDLIRQFKSDMKDVPAAMDGLIELETIFEYLDTSEIPRKYFQFAPYIARGLAYYTGPIWEFDILDGKVGSVAGCGRYDDTIGRLSGRNIPATGGSFGIERIVEVIRDRGMVKFYPTTTQAMVAIFSPEMLEKSVRIANLLRKDNIRTMLYSDPDKLDKQLKYADRKGIPVVIIMGPNEADKNTAIIKNMKTNSQQTVSMAELSLGIKRILSTPVS